MKVKKIESLEKGHDKNGVISQLKLGDNDFASSDKEICLNSKPFTEIFIVPKQTVIIQDLTT